MKKKIWIKKLILPFSFFILTCFFVLHCSDSTSSDDTITVTGTVYLDGRTDNSGVKISLYRPVVLDTAVVKLNEKYPTIGVPISQKTEFDHRQETALYSTTSKNEGSWEIENVAKGNYHVVAEKDSFGWKYLYDRDVSNSIDFDTLYRAIYLSNILTQDLSVQNSFLIIDNLSIPENITLNIGNGSTVSLRENARIEVNGTLILEGSEYAPVKVFSEDFQPWRTIESQIKANLKIQYSIIKNGINGIRHLGANLIFHHNIVCNNVTGLENFSISNGLEIFNNLFVENNIALNNNQVDSTIFENNVFKANLEALHIASSRKNIITHNIFYRDSLAINLNPSLGTGYTVSSVEIKRCNFNNNYVSIFLGKSSLNSFGNENNFYNPVSLFIRVSGEIAPIDTLNFQKNYWGLFEEDLIKEKIIDYFDLQFSKNLYYIDVRFFNNEPFQID